MPEFIKSLEKGTTGIHDVKIKFSSNLHKYLKSCEQNPRNKGILIQVPTSEPHLTIKVLVYPKLIQIDIGCSLEPIPCNSDGVLKFRSKRG